MAKFGEFDDESLQQFIADFDSKVNGQEMAKLMEDIGKTVSKLAINGTKKRTPVDTGLLRRNWTVGGLNYNGSSITMTISNVVEYAPHVEYGHRTSSGGWVEGQFMLRDTLNEIDSIIDQILGAKVENFLHEFFWG
jgi:hypothetical protein